MLKQNRSPVERGKAAREAVDKYFKVVEALRHLEPDLPEEKLFQRIDAGNPELAAAAKYVNDADIEAYTRAAEDDGRNPYAREWDAAVEDFIREHPNANENVATGHLQRQRPELFNAAFSDNPIMRFVHGADVELRTGRAVDLAEAYELTKRKCPDEARAVDLSTLFL